MKSYLKWKLVSFLALLKFIVEHPDISTDIPELAADVDVLQDTTESIKEAEQLQGETTSGVTKDTDKKKLMMARVVISKARKARPLAKRGDRLDLYEKLNFEKTYINQAPKVDALSRAKAIREVIKSNTSVFTNIKPADLTAMDDAIQDYNDSQLNPKAARDHKKAQGTDALDSLYQTANEAADNIYDLITGEYELTNEVLLDELDLKVGLEREGVRHNCIRATFIDANPPAGAITQLLEGALLKIVELNRTVKSDIDGVAEIRIFKAGSYHVEFSLKGFVTKQMIIHVKQGQTIQLEVELERG
jgi:hypothetical protein